MIILWLLLGCLFVGVPYFLFLNPYDLWPSVNAAGIGAAVYLTLLLGFILREKFSMLMRVLAVSVALILFVSAVLHWPLMEEQAGYQRSTLLTIRAVIARGILASEDVDERALPLFASYYEQHGKKESIVAMFDKKYRNQISNGIDTLRPWDYYPNKRRVQYFADTAVVIVSVDTIARGFNPAFANDQGHKGKVQSTTILSRYGVRHERNN